jgi:hypothetical protein
MISFIIFIGVCIEAGNFLVNTTYIDFSDLYQYDSGYYFVVSAILIIVGVMKAIIFYQIVKMFHSQKIRMTHPINNEVKSFIFILSYLSSGIGWFAFQEVKYTEWLVEKGVEMPDIQILSLIGADVWLFMGVTLFVIAHIYKRNMLKERILEI